MSGGHFDYLQYKLPDVVKSIQREINKSGRLKTERELKNENWRDPDWYKKYPEDLTFYKYPDQVIDEFKEGIKYIQLAQIYMQRIDWLISGDDGDDSFITRLKKDLNELKNKPNEHSDETEYFSEFSD